LNNWSLIFRLPAAVLFGMAVRLRHFLYDSHLLRSYTVPVPTVCVGNLAVGGTGKTPMVEWLVRTLSPHFRVAVLSRGYRRKSHGFVLADADATVWRIGDECMQLHKRFPRVPVAVCENRVKGIRRLLKECPDVQVVVLDDAFQHRRLRCGFSMLLTTADRPFVSDHMLPWGRLRDLVIRSRKADTVVVTKCPPTLRPIDKRLINKSLNLSPWQSLYFSSLRYAPFPAWVERLPAGADVLLVACIAQPVFLVDYVRSRFPNVRVLTFSDHHLWSASELKTLEKEALSASVVFTTDKDMARWQVMELSANFRSKLCPVSVSIEIEGADALEKQIVRYISSCRF